MKLYYLGHSCFLVDNGLRFLFDPFEKIGYEMDETYADVVFCSHSHYDHHATNKVQTPNLIDAPFCGRVYSLSVQSLTTSHDEVGGKKRGLNEVFKVYCQSKSFTHLGDIGSVDNAVIEFAKNTDFLFIPVGGCYTIDAKQAKELVDKIQPKHVIPMHYKTDECNISIAQLNEFTSLFSNVSYYESGTDISTMNEGVCVILR